jgi:hypothetical protein
VKNLTTFFFLIVPWINLLLLTCHGSASTNAPKSAPRLKQTLAMETLMPMLKTAEFATFYQTIDGQDLEDLKNKFEQLEPKERASLNYGALFNAGIITDENRDLFKPDIQKIHNYVDVPNDLKCWMNATLYGIANSSFFDDFLEIDYLLEDKWKKRPAANLNRAQRIIRSLREIVYEIRLGPETSPERLRKIRLNNFESLEDLHDLDTVTSFYHELFASYYFEQVEFVEKDPISGVTTHKHKSLNNHIPIEFSTLKEALRGHQTMTHLKGYGIIGALSCNLHQTAGFVELMYLHALFIILDPWGITARYLSASVKFHPVEDDHKPGLIDPYQGKLVFEDAEKKGSFHFFFNDWNFDYGASVGFRDIKTKKPLGKLIYRQRAKVDSQLILVAKTRGNINHMIAELFNFEQKKWETHTLFEPAQFSSRESADQSVYEDYTHFYQASVH